MKFLLVPAYAPSANPARESPQESQPFLCHYEAEDSLKSTQEVVNYIVGDSLLIKDLQETAKSDQNISLGTFAFARY